MPIDWTQTTQTPEALLSFKSGRAAAIYERRFGRPPAWIAAAPGRVNVIGEHVDYCDGLVLPMAIDKHVLVAAGPWPERVMRIYSQLTNQEGVIGLTQALKPGQSAGSGWLKYLQGVVHGFGKRNIAVPGLNAIVDSDLPMGGGLSSSAALEVATATVIELATERKLEPSEKALLCQQAEQQFAGVPCGIMDQFASVHGLEDHLLLIDCRTRDVTPVALHDKSVTLLVINTNVRHELGNSEYPLRRSQCEDAARRLGLETLRDATPEQLKREGGSWPEPVFRRARHVVGEIARTREAADAFRAGNWERAGELMFASHASLRDDFEVSCLELDRVVEMARRLSGAGGGVYGCRMTGGGFGGCCVALVKAEAAPQIAESIAKRYAAKFGRPPAMFVSRPAGGARQLSVPRKLPPE